MIFRLLLALSFFSANAFALPLGRDDLTVIPNPAALFADGYNFEGIVALDNCSASLIRLTKSLDTDPALVLTNGHCLETGMPQPGVVVTNQRSKRKMDILDPKTAKSLGRVTATRVLYSTMTKTDMTVYVLKETYSQILKKFNVRPLLLSENAPVIGQDIEVISGYWKRGFACKVELVTPTLREDKWTMVDSIRYSRPGCEIFGGTSGSPVIDKVTREVIGANNTVNESGEQCTLNNPCEVDAQGNVFSKKGYGYAQQTAWLYTCLDSKYVLDLNLPNCKLPK